MAPVVNKTLAVLAAAGIGVVTYAIYFDYKRRTDANFRKRLRMLNLCILHYVLFTASSGREKKKLDKSAAEEAETSAAAGDAALPAEEILATMARVKDDQVPTTPEEREKYFMTQVEKGEQLCARGRSTPLGLWRTFAHFVAKGQTLPLRLRWRSSEPFAFIPPPSS
jgi:import receptor subunit TOM20